MSEDADKIEEALERLKNSSLEIGKAIYSQGNDDEGSSEGDQQQEESGEQKEQEESEPKAEEAERAEGGEGEKKEEEKK